MTVAEMEEKTEGESRVQEELREGEEEEKVTGLLVDGDVVINEKDAEKIHGKGYGEYEEDGKLHLAPVEALLLAERGRLVVLDSEGRELTFKELAKTFTRKDPKLWTRYLVYRDLRSRGYVVKQGFGGGIDFRVYPRGSKVGEEAAKTLIYIVTEGKPINLKELDRVTKLAVSMRKKLTMALINRQGDVVYYNVLQMTF